MGPGTGLEDPVEAYLQREPTGQYILFLDWFSSPHYTLLQTLWIKHLIYMMTLLFIGCYCGRLTESIFELTNKSSFRILLSKLPCRLDCELPRIWSIKSKTRMCILSMCIPTQAPYQQPSSCWWHFSSILLLLELTLVIVSVLQDKAVSADS